MRGGWRHENQLRSAGCVRIAGVDEAGRGPLAGPVVAAAVILPHGFFTRGLDDSKVLTPGQRDRWFARLTGVVEHGIGLATVEEIDRLNILRANHLAMQRAVAALPGPVPDHVLVDGRPIGDVGFPYTALVDGDARSVSIAAASIVAKVTRDRIMGELEDQFPGYGFAQHKGYYTTEHVHALRQLGPCPAHRRSFAPVRQWQQLVLFPVDSGFGAPSGGNSSSA